MLTLNLHLFNHFFGTDTMKAKIKNTATAVALCLTASTGAAQAATIGDTSVKFTVYIDRKSTRLNSSHSQQSRMPSSA